MRRRGIRNGDSSKKVFAFVKTHVDQHGCFPSDAAVAAHMEWKTVSGVSDTYLRLVGWGLLTRHAVSGVSGRKQRYEYRIAEDAKLAENVS